MYVCVHLCGLCVSASLPLVQVVWVSTQEGSRGRDKLVEQPKKEKVRKTGARKGRVGGQTR